jgi:hypothetical protein
MCRLLKQKIVHRERRGDRSRNGDGTGQRAKGRHTGVQQKPVGWLGMAGRPVVAQSRCKRDASDLMSLRCGSPARS